MDFLAQTFKQFKSIGVEEEFILLAFVGLGVIQLLFLHYRLLRKNSKLFLVMVKKIDDTATLLVKKLKNLDDYHTGCANRSAEEMIKTWVQRKTLEEKVDTLEDQVKEVKKQMLFYK